MGCEEFDGPSLGGAGRGAELDMGSHEAAGREGSTDRTGGLDVKELMSSRTITDAVALV
jgi:hypothetical protein